MPVCTALFEPTRLTFPLLMVVSVFCWWPALWLVTDAIDRRLGWWQWLGSLAAVPAYAVLSFSVFGLAVFGVPDAGFGCVMTRELYLASFAF